MALDMAKYRRIFIEEAADHLAEISRALLDLEKDMGDAGAIDTIFRMAHSIKSMAASLGYEPVSDLSHRMEDRMEGVRAAGRVSDPAELGLLFRCLEALEAMLAGVSAGREMPTADQGLLAALATDDAAQPGTPPPVDLPPEAVGGEPKKGSS